MIFETLETPRVTRSVGMRFAKALDFLKDLNFEELPLGKTLIEGEELFVLKQEYLTKLEPGVWESHRRYADIQLIWEGEERCGFAHIGSLAVTHEYNCDDDYLLYSGSGQFLHLKKGMFLVFFPEDGHMPCLAVNEPSAVKKLVFKVAL